MNKKVIYGAVTAAGVAMFAVGASAGEGKGRSGHHWEEMDANGDGEITADEMSARFAAHLDEVDTDGSGGISKEEMKAYHEARRKAHHEARNPDKNNDGVVDRTEFLDAAQERFDRMDKNDDGVLSEDERRHRGGRGHHRRGGDEN